MDPGVSLPCCSLSTCQKACHPNLNPWISLSKQRKMPHPCLTIKHNNGFSLSMSVDSEDGESPPQETWSRVTLFFFFELWLISNKGVYWEVSLQVDINGQVLEIIPPTWDQPKNSRSSGRVEAIEATRLFQWNHQKPQGRQTQPRFPVAGNPAPSQGSNPQRATKGFACLESLPISRIRQFSWFINNYRA